MIITPFAIQDYAEIEMANEIGYENWNFKFGAMPILWGMNNSGTFWTLRDEQGILVIGGYHQLFDGVCEVVLFPSRRFVEHPKSAYRIIKKYVRDWTLEFKRVQLNCRAEEKFTRFAKALGFEQEGILRKFDHQGRDHVIMAIVR